MARAKLVVKNAFVPQKGEFYFIKKGSICATPCPWAKGKKSRKTPKK